MPKITNLWGKQITFQFDLINTESFIYDKNNEDYLNWIPCDIKLFEGEEMYTFIHHPTLSIEGLKNFFQRFNSLMQERENNPDPYSERYFEYCATEGEFIISFRNGSDEGDQAIVEMLILFNIAACPGISHGYFKGFSFSVDLNELKMFFDEIKKQLYYLTNGNECE